MPTVRTMSNAELYRNPGVASDRKFHLPPKRRSSRPMTGTGPCAGPQGTLLPSPPHFEVQVFHLQMAPQSSGVGQLCEGIHYGMCNVPYITDYTLILTPLESHNSPMRQALAAPQKRGTNSVPSFSPRKRQNNARNSYGLIAQVSNGYELTQSSQWPSSRYH